MGAIPAKEVYWQIFAGFFASFLGFAEILAGGTTPNAVSLVLEPEGYRIS